EKGVVNPGSRFVELYAPAGKVVLSSPGTYEELLTGRIVRDAHAANRERLSSLGVDDVTSRGLRGEYDALHLGVLRYEGAEQISKTESRNVLWPVGDSLWCPVSGSVPVVRQGIEIPFRTAGVRDSWNEEH